MNLRNRYRKYITYTGTAGILALSMTLNGCTKGASGSAEGNATPAEATEIQAVPETIAQLGLQGQVLPGLNDIDLPDAMTGRKQFFTESDRVHQIAGSILKADWTQAVETGRPLIFIIEGVLMYFSREQVKTLLSILAGAFSEFVLLAELMPPMAVKQAKHHDTLKSTNATFRWGTKSGKELEALCPGLTLLRENSFNDVMKTYTFRGWLFGSLPKLKDCNDRLAVYRYKRRDA